MIRKSHTGGFVLLPFGQRVYEKVVRLIDDSMARTGAQKVSLPLLLPADMWRKSGRWDSTGPELIKLQDRHGADFCLAPTHEESITSTVAQDLTSYRQLPLRLYQIGTKIRDEIRPRFGLLRAREFVMKDMYTFHASTACGFETYDRVVAAYKALFQSLGLPWAVVDADSGNIGGERSQEFHILSPVGEDCLLSCEACDYAANVEKAVGRGADASPQVAELVGAAVAKWSQGEGLLPPLLEALGSEPTVEVFREAPGEASQGRCVAVVVPPGDKVNELKVQHSLGWGPLVKAHRMPEGSVQLCVDSTVGLAMPCPALGGLAMLDSAQAASAVGDYREAQQGDLCLSCTEGGADSEGARLQASEGIEVGHCFFLGSKYSSALGATFTPEGGKHKIPCEMGCYGLGVTRLIAAVVEASHDQHGIIWPEILAPYKVAVVVLDAKKAHDLEAGERVYDQLASVLPGEVCLDDRGDSAGRKMADAQLVGYPWTVLLGRAWRKEGHLELQVRGTGERIVGPPEEIYALIRARPS